MTVQVPPTLPQLLTYLNRSPEDAPWMTAAARQARSSRPRMPCESPSAG